MKCNNCKLAEMVCTYETFRFNNKKYTSYECPECESQEFIEIKPIQRKKISLLDNVALVTASIMIVLLTLYVGLHIDQFITTH